MPIFDNEPGFDNVSRDYDSQKSYVTPMNTSSEVSIPKITIPDLAPRNPIGATVDQISRLAEYGPSPMSINSAFQSVSKSELLANKRYDYYDRDVDLENIHGLTQSFWSRIGNGFAKAGIRAAGAFAQTFYTIPDDIVAIKNGNFKKLMGGDDMIALDQFTKNAEELFPNYYSRYEKANPYTSGFGNIIGDKIISNLGYTVGTIGASVVQNAIIDAAISGIFSGGAGAAPGAVAGAATGLLRGIGKASLVLNKILSGTNKLDKVLDLATEVNKTGQQVLNLKKLIELNQGRTALTKAFTNTRYGITMWNAAQSEANIEGRQGYTEIKEALIEEYKNANYGQMPTGDELKKIEDYAVAGGLSITAGNMPLLLISNAIQFDGILKSFSKSLMATKTLDTQLGKLGVKSGTIDEVEKIVEKNIYDKIWNTVKTPAKSILSEGIYEEGGQFAVSQGVKDYYTTKYKNKESASILNSAIKGLSDQFTTAEGIENMVIGGITGGLFSIVETAVQKKYGNTDPKLNAVISNLNNSKISGAFDQKYESTESSIEILKQMEDAVKSNDIRKFKNLKSDLFFTKVMQRINMGMHDVTIEQLEMMRDLPKDQFENMFGVDFNTSNKQTVDQYVDKLISTANNIKETSEAIDTAFKNPITYINSPKSDEDNLNNQRYRAFENWKLDIKNFSFSQQDRKERLNNIQSELTKLNPSLNNELVGSLTDKTQLQLLSESYAQEIIEKEEYLESVPSKDRAKIRSEIKKLKTVAEKINMAIANNMIDPNLFKELINLEISNRDFENSQEITFDKIEKLMNYSSDIKSINLERENISKYLDVLTSKEGFEKYLEEKEKEFADQFISQEEDDVETSEEDRSFSHAFQNNNNAKEQPEVGREYETTKVNLVKPKKEGSKYKVVAPNGTTSYFNSRNKALEFAKEINADISDLSKVKVLALNEDGTIKIEDVNGNIQNITVSELEGYKKLETKQEKLQKEKEVVEIEQKKIEISSGEIPTISDETTQREESKLKLASELFYSTTSESEDWNNPEQSAPHIRRSRIFLNNVAGFENRNNYKVIIITPTNAKNAGLEGIVQLSYKKTLDTPLSKIENATDPENGFMAQVFIYTDKSGSYFVNEKGEKIGKVGEQLENIESSGIVFQTMNAATLKNSKNEPKYRKEEEEQANKELAAYKIYRKQKFADDSVGQAYPFKVSRGVRRKTEIKESNHIHHILGKDGQKIISSESGIIQVVVTGKINFNGKLLNFPKGTVVFKHGDTIDFANNKKLTPTQVNNIFAVIEALANNMINASEKGEKVVVAGPYVTFLQNVLYWKFKSDTISDSQISIDPETMSFKIGNRSFELESISENKEKILELLQEAYFTVNNKTLSEGITNKFIEYVVDEKGEFTPVVWNSYQEYLISDKTPDNKFRSVEETPLTTNAPKPTELFPTSYVQRYSVIEEGTLEFPYDLVKNKPEIKKQEITEESELDKEVQSFQLASGKSILYKYIKNEDNNISIEILNNDALNEIVENKTKVNAIRIELDKLNIDNSQMVDEDAVKEYLAIAALADLNKKLSNQNEEKPSSENSPVDFSKIKRGRAGGNFRKVGISDSKRMTEEDIKEFKKWHAENVPNIPFEILEQMIVINSTESAWGVFEDGVAKFVRGGLKGTEYHEVFEAIWANLLTETEKKNLLKEFKAKKGTFIDRQSGKEYSYNDDTLDDNIIKERIADDFADYRLGKIKNSSIKGMIKEFFNRIMNFFKSFITKQPKQEKSLKEKLFDEIDKGRFKNEKFINKNIEPQYRAVEGLTEEETNDFVNDIIGHISVIIFGQEEGYRKELLFSPDKISGKGIFEAIKQNYIDYGLLESIGERRWEIIQERVIEKLKTLGTSFDLENDINNEESNSKDYAPDAFSVDWKQTSSSALKFMLSTIPLRLQQNQKGAVSLSFPKGTEENQGFILSNSIGGFKIADFNKIFATLLDKLSNTNSIEDFTNKLIELAETDTTFLSIFARLGGDLSTKRLNLSNKNDWRLFIQFYNLFSKQKPEALIQFLNNGEVYSGAANLFTAAKNISKVWTNSIKLLSNSEDSIVSYDKGNKVYKVDNNKIKSFPITLTSDRIKFLNAIGIDFPIDAYSALSDEVKLINGKKTSQKDAFVDAVSKIHEYLGKNSQIMTVKQETLGISGPLRTLSELYVYATNPVQESTYSGVEGQKIGSFAENNASSMFENDFNESETLDELLQKRPELNGLFSKNSDLLKPGGRFFNKDRKRINKIKVLKIDGTKDIDGNKDIPISKLTLGQRLTQEINQNIAGNYYVLVPGDGSTEWMMNLGNEISFEEIEAGTYKQRINEIFKNYLFDEVKLALFGENETLTVKKKSKQLRFFKDILNDKNVNDIEKLLNENNTSFEKIEKYINDNIESVNSSIEDFINEINNKTFDQLLSSSQITQQLEDQFNLSKFNSEFIKKHKLELSSKERVDNFLKFINVNYIINNIELHKVLFGDPYQFKIKENGSLDETKRIKLFLSPASRLFDSLEFNDFLNKEYNKVDGELLDSKDVYTYHQFKSHTKTATLSDVEVLGSIAKSDLPETIKQQYGTNPKTGKPLVNETDAMSWLGDNTYREIKIKLGKWSDKAEEWHQWQMAYTRNKLAEKGLYEYKNNKLKELDQKRINEPAPAHHIEMIKPIVRGNKFGKTEIDNVVDKFSQMPLYYSMVEGTNMEKLYLKMKEEGIGYVIVESGRKVGSEGNNKIYNEDGSFNEEEYTNTINVSWKTYGIIVETASEGVKYQTRGSQITKIVSGDLQENGEFISQEAKEAYEENLRDLEELNDHNYTEFLKKLGVKEIDGVFYNEDNSIISETLMYEMLRRDVSENVKDSIKIDKNNEFLIPFEASPSYEQIKNIIYSMVNKSLTSSKVNGAPYVQAPSTMFETGNRKLAIKDEKGNWQNISTQEYNKLSPEEKKKVLITDNTLKFYTKEQPWCEIMLPAWFKDKFIGSKFKTDAELIEYLNESEDGPRILSGIGFRIPTQSLASVERFKVKGFLPSYMGYTVIVPSEITAKAGSDFDIDKLNIYLKSVYVDGNGDIRLIQYKENKEETLRFYRKEYDNITRSKIYNIEDAEEFKTSLLEVLKIVEDQYYKEGLEDIAKSELFNKKQLRFYNKYENVIQSIINDAYAEGLSGSEKISKELEILENKKTKFSIELFDTFLRNKFAESMYKKALENRYFESLEKLIDLQGLEKLLSPVSDAGLENLSKELDSLIGYDENKIKGRLLDRTYMTSLRHDFITGKAWVGIAAVNITGLTLRQKGKIYLDPDKITLLDKYLQGYVKDLNFVVPTNKIQINNTSYVSLSGLKTADGTNQLLSERFSGYATAFVDIAANPFISKIVKSNSIVSTFMFLEAIGAGETGVYFLNQPIINEYLKILDKKNTKSLTNANNIKLAKSLFPSTEKVNNLSQISKEELKNNIKEYYSSENKLDATKNAQQQMILDEFIKYSVLAGQLFKFNQATNFDTTRINGSETLFKKNVLLEKVRNKSVIANVDDVLNNSFIGKLSNLLNRSNNAIGKILKFESPEIRQYTEEVLYKYANREFISNDVYEKISNLIKNSFLDYIIQNNSMLNREIEELLIVEASNIATQLEELKQKYPSVRILQEFEGVYGERENGAKSIKLRVNPKGDVYSENIYIEMMRELRDSNAELNNFYNNLIKASILQGSANSPINFRNIIPIEDYAKIISPIISNLQINSQLNNFVDSLFERNNFNNSEIFTKYTPRKVFGNLTTGKKINIPGFINSPSLGIVEAERKIITLAETFNAMDIQSDFISIPRIFNTTLSTPNKDFQVWVDLKTGERLGKEEFEKFKLEGDLSIKDAYYYKKVYTDEYNEFGERVPLRIWIKGQNGKLGYHVQVYKLINVYGDGYRASEYPNINLSSVIDNGSIKIEKELDDKDIISALKPVAPVKQEEKVKKINFQVNEIFNKVDQDSYTINMIYEGDSYTMVIDTNGQVEVASRYDIEKLDDIDVNPEMFKFSEEDIKEIFRQIYLLEKPSSVGSILDQRENKLEYTTNQEKALLDVQRLIDTNKKGYYLLSGYAGTGKTTIVENIVNYAKLRNKEVFVMAPTNKAVRVLEKKLKGNKNISLNTLHKLLYGTPNEETGEWTKARMFNNSVIVVDESSMINKDLMNDLINATKESNNNVIFIGDGFQLEQIGESAKLFESLNNDNLFKQTYDENLFGSSTLTEVKRQALYNDILKLATAIRKDNKAYIPKESTKDIQVINDKQKFIIDFRESVKNEEDSVMIVATNSERMLMNKVARFAKFEKESKNILNREDKLISIANSNSLSNSETFIIKDFQELEKYNITLNVKDTSNTYDVYFTRATLDNGQTTPILFFPEMDKPSVYHSQIMKDIDGELRLLLSEEGLIYLDKRNKTKLSSEIIISTYGYAITAHKSQGSQWNKVFVNQNYIAPSWNGARWFYTAVTRASDNLEIYNSGKNISITNSEINNKIISEISNESKENSLSLQTDEQIIDSDEFKSFAETELTKNPNLTIEQILEYFKKCGNG